MKLHSQCMESHSKFHGSSHHQPGYISAFLQISQISHGAVSQRHSLGPPFDGPIHLSAFHVLLGAMLQGGAPVSDSSRSVGTNHSSFTMVYACLCLRQENRTCVLLLFWVLLFVLGLGWGGVGGHVNVPCTSYMIYCHVAKISGIFYYVTCCYAAEISSVGWGRGGVGWGGMLTFLVLRTGYIAMLVWVGVGVGWGGGAC